MRRALILGAALILAAAATASSHGAPQKAPQCELATDNPGTGTTFISFVCKLPFAGRVVIRLLGIPPAIAALGKPFQVVDGEGGTEATGKCSTKGNQITCPLGKKTFEAGSSFIYETKKELKPGTKVEVTVEPKDPSKTPCDPKTKNCTMTGTVTKVG